MESSWRTVGDRRETVYVSLDPQSLRLTGPRRERGKRRRTVAWTRWRVVQSQLCGSGRRRHRWVHHRALAGLSTLDAEPSTSMRTGSSSEVTVTSRAQYPMSPAPTHSATRVDARACLNRDAATVACHHPPSASRRFDLSPLHHPHSPSLPVPISTHSVQYHSSPGATSVEQRYLLVRLLYHHF